MSDPVPSYSCHTRQHSQLKITCVYEFHWMKNINLFFYFVTFPEIAFYSLWLFRKKYPAVKVPDKNPMPRPVDVYFDNWQGPKRPEFKAGIAMSRYDGNQKWLMWCLEQFLNQNGIAETD